MISGERAGGNVEVEMGADEVVVGLDLVAAVNIVEDESVKVYG